MQVIIERRCIVANTNADAEVLRVLFNAGIIRGAYLIWSQTEPDDGEFKPLPSGYNWIGDYQPTAFVMLNEEIELPHSGQEKAKAKIEKEIKEIEESKQKEVDNIFGWIK